MKAWQWGTEVEWGGNCLVHSSHIRPGFSRRQKGRRKMGWGRDDRWVSVLCLSFLPSLVYHLHLTHQSFPSIPFHCLGLRCDRSPSITWKGNGKWVRDREDGWLSFFLPSHLLFPLPCSSLHCIAWKREDGKVTRKARKRAASPFSVLFPCLIFVHHLIPVDTVCGQERQGTRTNEVREIWWRSCPFSWLCHVIHWTAIPPSHCQAFPM